MSRQIEVVIGPDGSVTVEAVGFKGGSCEKMTAALEQALGAPGKRNKKPDYYVQEVGKQGVGR